MGCGCSCLVRQKKVAGLQLELSKATVQNQALKKQIEQLNKSEKFRMRHPSRTRSVNLQVDASGLKRVENPEMFFSGLKKEMKRTRRASLTHQRMLSQNDNLTMMMGSIRRAGRITYLPRGGLYVETKIGPIQFGLPPETIKDCMLAKLEVPVIYIVPKERFNLQLGLNCAEVEFPAYYAFFLCKKSITLVCHKKVEDSIYKVVKYTLEGPPEELIHVDEEYGPQADGKHFAARPDFSREIPYFIEPREGRVINADTLLSFKNFELPDEESTPGFVSGSNASSGASSFRSRSTSQGSLPKGCVCDLGDGVLVKDCGDSFEVFEGDELVAEVPSSIRMPLPTVPKVVKTDFDLPDFGITMLGSSHGFDPRGSTCGFVMWMNGRGVMVDPPPHSGIFLQSHGIPPSYINTIILTHCHGDHDAGTFQKILQEHRLTVMTTQTVMESFVRKYSLISQLSENFVQSLFTFRPVRLGEPMPWEGGFIKFFYALHALPCIGFEAFFRGKSLVYSSDHFNDPIGIQTLYERGILSEARKDFLLDFPWHHDLILHEAGIPPIHTPIETLLALPDDIKKKLWAVHLTQDKAEAAGLQYPLPGMQNTIRLETEPWELQPAIHILELVSNTDLFSDFSIDQTVHLLQIAKAVKYPANTMIAEKGAEGDCMYLIAQGVVRVLVREGVEKYFTVGDYLGEISVVTGAPRSASVVAATAVEMLEFERHAFMELLLQDPALHTRLMNLANMRTSHGWLVMDKNSILSRLTSTQKTQLLSHLTLIELPKGGVVWSAYQPANRIAIIFRGRFRFKEVDDPDMLPFECGSCIGDVIAIRDRRPYMVSLMAIEPSSCFILEGAPLLSLLEDNPLLLLAFLKRRVFE